MQPAEPLVNWLIRRSQDVAEEWEDMLRAVRREVGDRTINKTDIVCALMELAGTRDVRAKLTRSLNQRRAS